MTYYHRFDGLITAEDYANYAINNQIKGRKLKGWNDSYDICDDSIVNIGRSVIDEGYTSFREWSKKMNRYLSRLSDGYTKEALLEINLKVWNIYFKEQENDRKIKIRQIAKSRRNVFLKVLQNKISFYLSCALIVISQLFIGFYNEPNGLSIIPVLQIWIIPILFASTTERRRRKMYYLIPVIMIIINIIYLFITNLFISYIPNIKFLFVLSSLLLAISSVILAFNDEDFSYINSN